MADRGIVDTIRQAHAAGLSLELTHGQLRLLLVELDVRASYAQHQSQAITRLEQQLAEKDAEIARLRAAAADWRALAEAQETVRASRELRAKLTEKYEL